MTDEHDFKGVVDTLENQDVVTEEIYRLEDIKYVYGDEEYIEVMDAVYSDDFDEARSLLEQYQQREE